MKEGFDSPRERQRFCAPQLGDDASGINVTSNGFCSGPFGSKISIVSVSYDASRRPVRTLMASATGVQLFSTAGLNPRFNYDGKFSENSRENAFDAKVTVNY